MSKAWSVVFAIAGVLFVASVAASVYTLSKTADTAKRVTRLEQRPCRAACREAIVNRVLDALKKGGSNQQTSEPSSPQQPPPSSSDDGGGHSGDGGAGDSGGQEDPPPQTPPSQELLDPVTDPVCETTSQVGVPVCL